jgi:hypothetical protein
MATLQDLIAAIPTANDGDVISIDYHNTMLAAIKMLAAQSGSGGSSGPATVNLAFAPQLSAVDSAPWQLQSTGNAAKPGGNVTQASGWMQVQLPDGYQIDHMVVNGNKSGNVGSFNATLMAASLTTGALQQNPPPLGVSLDTAATDAAGNFSATAKPVSTMLVDNTHFRYLFLLRIAGADAAATATVFGIQIVCKQAITISFITGFSTQTAFLQQT